MPSSRCVQSRQLPNLQGEGGRDGGLVLDQPTPQVLRGEHGVVEETHSSLLVWEAHSAVASMSTSPLPR